MRLWIFMTYGGECDWDLLIALCDYQRYLAAPWDYVTPPPDFTPEVAKGPLFDD